MLITLGACAPEPLPEPADPSLDGCGWGGTAGETGAGLVESVVEESPGFQSYVAEHVFEHEGGWVVEGDLFTREFSNVVAAYRDYAGEESLGEGLRGSVKCDTDKRIDQILDPARKLKLTYCLDETWDQVPDFREQALQAIAAATGQWESSADINFIAQAHGPECSLASGDTHFVVQYGGKVCSLFGCLNGLAFFPNETPVEERILFLYEDAFTAPPPRLKRVTTHELGHVLGLFHEQVRFEGLGCSLGAGNAEDYRGVTRGDPNSVMAYTICEDTSPLPDPSPLDRVTLANLYNLPRPSRSGDTPDAGVLIWHRPQAADFTVWEPGGVDFLVSSDCYNLGCEVGDVPWWKPLLYREQDSVDVFMYGPGELEDRRLRDLAGAWSGDTPQAQPGNNNVPVLLEGFFAAQDRSLWWLRPEQSSDPLWRGLDGAIQVSNDFDWAPFTDGPYLATHGRFENGAAESLWLNPLDHVAYLARFVEGDLVALPLDVEACLLSNGAAYNAVPGDYDGDEHDEIAWYDFRSGQLVYWPAIPNCLLATSTFVGQGKPAALRLIRERDHLMLYRPDQQQVDFYDPPSGELALSLPVSGDASPILRDFDQNGCTDILWFSPEREQSQLWRSDCQFGFSSSLVTPPSGAYPLGYGLGHGRR